MGIPFRGPAPSVADQTGILGALLDWSKRLSDGLTAPTTVGTASEAGSGVTQLATIAEAVAGLATKAISPKNSVLLTGMMRGTKTQRLALTGTQLFDGLRFFETDSGITWLYNVNSGLRVAATGWRIWSIPWTYYTPSIDTVVQGTGGSATSVARYCVIDGQLTWYSRKVFGTSGASVPNGPWQLAAPLNPDTGTYFQVDELDYAKSGQGVWQQNGVQTRPLQAYLSAGNSASMQLQANFMRADATYVTDSGGNLSAGQTPAAGQTIQVEMTVRLA